MHQNLAEGLCQLYYGKISFAILVPEHREEENGQPEKVFAIA